MDLELAGNRGHRRRRLVGHRPRDRPRAGRRGLRGHRRRARPRAARAGGGRDRPGHARGRRRRARPGSCGGVVDETVAARGRLDIVVNNAGGPPPGTFDSDARRGLGRGVRALAERRRAPDPARAAAPARERPRPGRQHRVVVGARADPQPDALERDPSRRRRLGEDAGPRARPRRHHREHDRAGQDRHATACASCGRTTPTRPPPSGPTSRRVPARRLGRPDEIGAAVAFLCSTRAAYISGTVLPVDGGLLRGVW